MANDPNNAWQEFWQLPRTINQSGHQLVYSPFFAMGTLGKHYRLVLTIHDMIYFKFRTPPQWLPWHIRLGWRLFHLTILPLRWQLNRAQVVATVSNTAHDQLVTAHATRRQIVPVPNAADNHFYDPSNRPRHTFRELIYIGAFTPYKNVETLIAMMQFLPDYRLNLCGKAPQSRLDELRRRADQFGVAAQINFTGPVDDDQYQAIMRRSIAAISASRIEGFGLPLIEAQCAGVPFIAADTPIFHEIGERSVQYFDPDDPKAAAQCVRNLTDPQIAREFVTRGRQNSARYTWDHSATRAHQIIKSL